MRWCRNREQLGDRLAPSLPILHWTRRDVPGSIRRVSDRGGFQQERGQWTTPDGPNVRYTIRLHVHGEDRDELGGVRAVDRKVDLRVVTPLGEHTAAVVAADVFRRREPRSAFAHVELLQTEQDFVTEPSDIWDDAATAR